MSAKPAANSDSFRVSTPAEREIRMTRLFSAPRELVFEVMNKPEHVSKWWGQLCDGEHTMPVCEIDFRVGGKWRFVGKGPRGEYGFHGVYREIDAPSRVVFTEIFDPFPDAESVVTAELISEGAQTRLIVTAEYPSQTVRDTVIGTGMAQGAAQSYDALERVLETLLTAKAS